MEEFKGLPGIEEYLAAQGNGHPVEVQELDHVVEALVAYCGLTKEQSTRVLSLFFQEIRSAMLKGETVDIRGLGSFFISSPVTTDNTKKVFAKFKPKRSLLNRMNHDRTRE
jgi:nucleoid DNA-binding protein